MTTEQLDSLVRETLLVEVLAQRVVEKLMARMKQALVVYTGSNISAAEGLEAMGRLRVIYPNLMKLTYDNTRTRANQVIGGAEDVKSKSPLQLFEELYEQQNNQPMSDEQRAFARELIESIREGMA